MLRNYFVTILRQITKNKIFSSINILGLALGMASCLVIAQYVNFHTSFEQHLSKSGELYRIESDAFKNGKSLGQNIKAPSMITQSVSEQSPEIEAFTRFYSINYANSSIIYQTEEKQINFEQSGIFGTDKGTFELFDLTFVAGSDALFDEPQKAILTEQTATKYFNDLEKAIGQTFSISGNTGSSEFELIGIVKDLPRNTHLSFEVLVSLKSLDQYTQSRTSWVANDMLSYLWIKDPEDQARVLNGINRLFNENSKETYDQGGYDLNFYLRPVEDIHMYSQGSEDFSVGIDNRIIIALSIVAVIILFIAWINYMNLSLVRTLERLKEVGIRKCMGSSLKQITSLFILEAFVINLIAFGIALITNQIFENQLMSLTGLPPSALMNSEILLYLALLIVGGTLIVGFYPYALLKTVKTVNVLIGRKGKVGNGKMRKALVFVQFIITFLLITGTITVYKQINFMREADLGIDIENILVIKSPPGDINSKDREDVANFNTLKNSLLNYASIAEITNAGEIPGEPVSWGSNLYIKNSPKENSVSTGLISMDLDFPKFFGIEVVAGRALREGDDPWSKQDVVINEKLSEMLGFSTPEEAIGAEIAGFYAPLTVRGVLKNHHHTSLHNDYRPLAYILSSWTEYYFVKLKLDDQANTGRHEQLAGLVNTIKEEWGKVFIDYQMDYFFLDRSFDAQYKEDIRFGKIFSAFSGLAILIACLGLFGLTSFTIQQRTKEIGIRKTLGASVNHLIMLLSREYLALVLIACIVGLPVASWLMSQWLENYVFRIDLGWWFYVVPVVFILALAVTSIISKVLSTARVNPVESLRNE